MSKEVMLSHQEARRLMLERASAASLPAAQVTNWTVEEPSAIAGRVLAADICAPAAVPDFDNSAMDGYVFHAADLVPEAPGFLALPLSGLAAMGKAATTLKKGTCQRIYTGSPLPASSESDSASEQDLIVIPQENCTVDPQTQKVKVLSLSSGSNIRPKGQNYQKGELVCSRGSVCTPELLSVIAAAGLGQISLYRRLRIALCITGDELVQVGTALAPGQIYDSNSVYLRHKCQQLACETQTVYLPDNYEQTKQQMHALAQQCDLLICSGGASVGERDYVKEVILEAGEVWIRKVAIKPGKPYTFASLAGAPVACLPGNPLSVYITFLYFVLPYIEIRQGKKQISERLCKYAAPCDIRAYPRTQFLFGCEAEQGEIALLESQSSALLKHMYLADGALIVPAQQEVAKGEYLDWLPFH